MDDTTWEKLDWTALDRLRAMFLDGTSGGQDYWRSRSDLETYDATFAQRIGWKWQFVLRELTRRGWSPPEGDVIEWGCGSGIAARTYLRQFGKAATRLVLHDRSMLAVNFAQERARQEFPELPVETRHGQDADAAVVLLSHVLSELSAGQLEEVLSRCAAATTIVWVEPGTHADSHKLIAIRERLRGQFQIVAPCTHQAVCGMLAGGCERHWCHHFATPPVDIHTDGNWRKFGQLAGIDLRALPLSFLVLDKRPAPPLPPNALRLIGRARVYKAYAMAFVCDETGVRDQRVMKRHCPEEYHHMKRGDSETLQAWRIEGMDAVETLPI